MQNQKWTDERVIAALEKVGQPTMLLNNKSRGRIQRALLEENARLWNERKSMVKPRRSLFALFASPSSH